MSLWTRIFGAGKANAAKSPAPTAKVAGVSLSIYRSERFHFTMRSPEDWEVIFRDEKKGEWTIPVGWAGPKTSEGRPAFLVNVRESEILNRNANVTKIHKGPDGKSWTAPTSPQEYIELSKPSIPFPELRHEAEKVTELAGMEAAYTTYSYRGSRGRVREMTVTLFGMSATYQLIAEAPEVRFSAWLPLFEALIASFALGSESAGASASITPRAAADTAIGIYNQGVDQFDAARFADAERTFQRALGARDATLSVRMVAAYARAISLGQLRRPVEIPGDLQDKTDETGSTYLAYTAAGYLVRDGHRVAVKSDRTSVVDARIGQGLYRFAFSSLLGNFSGLASRIEGTEALRVRDLAEKPDPRKEDVYANALTQKLRSGAPWPTHMPSSGFPESL